MTQNVNEYFQSLGKFTCWKQWPIFFISILFESTKLYCVSFVFSLVIEEWSPQNFHVILDNNEFVFIHCISLHFIVSIYFLSFIVIVAKLYICIYIYIFSSDKHVVNRYEFSNLIKYS